jgi:hypothetical protein
MKVVITQSMLFPWAGLLEQMRLADVFVHYDDVQFSKGSFTNRVQVKTATGLHWMTVPLRNLQLGSVIDEVKTAPAVQWRDKHLSLLEQSFKGAPYAEQALSLAREVYAGDRPSIGHLARASMVALGRYFGLLEGKRVLDVRELDIGGSGSQRVLEIVRAVGGTIYATGHGARNYLNHEAFEQAGVKVQYMRYECNPYPQRWGEFTPYVTGLDLVANLGRDGRGQLSSPCIPWRDFLQQT